MKVTEEQQLAELFLDLKGKRRKRLDWIAIAQRCKALADRYRSVHDLAEKLGVSDHLVRSIMSLLNLPRDVQKMVREGKILYDAAYRLNTLTTPAKQVQVAKVIGGLPSHVQREIIQYAKSHPDADLLDYQKRLVITPAAKERIHLIVVPVETSEFAQLRRLSERNRKSIQDIVLEAVREFVVSSGKT